MCSNFLKFVKAYIFIINILCLIVGLLLLIFGLASIITVLASDTAIEEFGLAFPLIIIFLGVITAGISSLGYFGVKRECRCMLWTYAGILDFVFLLQLICGITGLVMYTGEESRQRFTNIMFHEFESNYKHSAFYRGHINDSQQRYMCCGIYGPDDYKRIGVKDYPGTCCGKTYTEPCSTPYSKGCGEELYSGFSVYFQLMSVIALILCGVEITAAVSAFMFAANI